MISAISPIKTRWLLRGVVGLGLAWGIGVVALLLAVIIVGNRDNARPAHAIIVLGSGVNPNGTPSKTLTVRAQHGASLYADGIAPVVICAGGVTGVAPRSEADACRETLEQFGVAPADILLEESSINTEQNVYYTRQLMHQQQMQSAVVVSSRYHLLRARWLFWRATPPPSLQIYLSPARIGYLTPTEITYSYLRELAAFHWQLIRDRLDVPYIRVPVP